MISGKMTNALNTQLNKEIFSSYLYLSMAAYFEATSFSGFAKWMRLQAAEEYEHGLKFFDYLTRVGGRVTLEVIEKPKSEWKSPLEIFEESLKHEIFITDSINELVNLAVEEKDHATKLFLNWFVEEQIEEVDNVRQIIDKFNLLGDSKGSLFMLDRDMGKRGQK